ncbi:NAD(P)-dependent oxidoreductase [Planomonospora venezuelensis]|uniref:3-hydroxyisobutyrate dehydrogenase-like beta-hydroxyacid dehydrogenase n=2 Tax=Actinomycetes TaxID=1760 RepID=A0A841D825_PLAVE|nr:NAD(P)-binding domain-containing protein [Planomonospora venezuelensis]MBB5963566.1 3-hydroxyisobutyrate dehydrogenase-like beta-hydroxyacid dehydrogenase [Planomonospora venezuelensis]GIN02085.1 6-phosphogluconate dehydrogenase [Planomonospora venezuelensis]
MTDGDRSPVTVLGLGPMGRALATAFLESGHPTTVWNRTASKADALAARGASRADSVADAVAASPLTIVCVIDYDAVRAVTEPAAGALRGRTLVNLTADSPENARRTAAWAAEHGIDYLDGSIMTPTGTIGGPGALVLYSGPEEVHRRHRDTLASLGGAAVHLGADPGRAAAYDVALLDLFWTSMSGLVHAFALASAEGVTARELAPFARGISDLMPGIIDEFAGHVDDGRHPGDASTVRSALAGMEHIAHAARGHGLDTGVLDAAAAVARRAVGSGHGDDGFSRLAETLAGPER